MKPNPQQRFAKPILAARWQAVLLGVFAGLAPTASHGQLIVGFPSDRQASVKVTSLPTTGARTAVRTGETMLSSERRWTTETFQVREYLNLAEQVRVSSRLTIRNGAQLDPIQFPGYIAWCVPGTMRRNMVGRMDRYVCFRDLTSAEDGVFEQLDENGRIKQKFAGAKYLRRTNEEVTASRQRTFRQELIYSGSGGGVLRVHYREYVDDTVRPAFTQEASYDLTKEGETTIAFKGATIRVLTVDGIGAEYIVASPFAPNVELRAP